MTRVEGSNQVEVSDVNQVAHEKSEQSIKAIESLFESDELPFKIYADKNNTPMIEINCTWDVFVTWILAQKGLAKKA